ncbi:MAG: transglutaminaseTgpA domain-containing protein, partial [Oceanococcaceae bacterium]
MARTEQSVDWLAAPRIGRILLLLGMLAIPHMLAMPLWASAAVLLAGLWRWWLARRARSMPPMVLRLALAGALATAVGIYYGGVNGLEAGGALLVCMTAMKLLETRSQRDCRLLVFLGYMLILAQMLRSQDIPWTLWMIAALTLNTAVLIDLQHPQGLLPWKHNLRLSGRLLLKAAPLAIIFFVLFPRIPGPLWGLPRDASAGRAGLSDSMEPGIISQLSQSDDVAFRVRFEGDAPPNRELYWRGPVFADYDGLRWKPLNDVRVQPSSAMQPEGPIIRYEIQLDPHGRRYLLALDLPTGSLPSNAQLNADYVLQSREAIMDARLVPLESSTQWSLGLRDASWELDLYRKLPDGLNPRTLELAKRWSSGTSEPIQYVQRVLRMFREEPYSYTLEPPLLRGFHRIDQFLFESRAGFCEHFAAAFVVLMRAAGIPARVVTGYQGAENNGSYYIVRQSDAHAWTEIGLAGEGWTRIDPTAAIAPERIELGLAAALADSSLLPTMSRGRNFRGTWLVSLRLAWDRIDAAWNRG